MRSNLFILFVFLGTPLLAQFTTPKFSNEFLSIPIGGRAVGMGGTQVAGVNGAESGYWNPSFLLDLERDHNISLMHIELFGGVANHDFAAYATKPDSVSAIGVSIIRLGIDNIPDTRFLYDASGRIDYSNISFFSAADLAILLSYARDIPALKGLRAGVNFKIINRKAGDFARSWGFGIDLGIHYKVKKWTLAAMVRDITGTYNAWSHSSELIQNIYASTGNTIPENSVEVTLPLVAFGIKRVLISKQSWDIKGLMDVRMTFDGRRNVLLGSRLASLDPSLGFEYTLKSKVYVRTGLSNFQKADNKRQVDPHFGMGIGLNKFRVDYGLSRLKGLSEGLFSHTVSLNIHFDG